MFRENTKEIRIGDRVIGGNNPILIQSMTNTKTEDVKAKFEDGVLKLCIPKKELKALPSNTTIAIEG